MAADENEFSEASGSIFRGSRSGKTIPGRPRRPLWPLIGMSFGEVFLGGLLSSRARLRFPRCTQFCHKGLRSYSGLQRTATRRAALCLTKGRRPSSPPNSPTWSSNKEHRSMRTWQFARGAQGVSVIKHNQNDNDSHADRTSQQRNEQALLYTPLPALRFPMNHYMRSRSCSGDAKLS